MSLLLLLLELAREEPCIGILGGEAKLE